MQVQRSAFASASVLGASATSLLLICGCSRNSAPRDWSSPRPRGKTNPADVLTKYRSGRDAFGLLAQAGLYLAPGRPGCAPTRSKFVIGQTSHVPTGFSHLPAAAKPSESLVCAIQGDCGRYNRDGPCQDPGATILCGLTAVGECLKLW